MHNKARCCTAYLAICIEAAIDGPFSNCLMMENRSINHQPYMGKCFGSCNRFWIPKIYSIIMHYGKWDSTMHEIKIWSVYKMWCQNAKDKWFHKLDIFEKAHQPLSRSTSSKTSIGLFPPSSRKTGCKQENTNLILLWIRSLVQNQQDNMRNK